MVAITTTTTTITIITIIFVTIITSIAAKPADIFSMPGAFTMPGGRAPGADGSCVLRSAAILGRRTIWRAHGRITVPRRAVHTSARLSCGVITLEKLSATRMASGSCRAAMMVMRFARARGRLPAPLHSGTPMHQRSRG